MHGRACVVPKLSKRASKSFASFSLPQKCLGRRRKHRPVFQMDSNMPLFSFGVIADVQYGDDVDGANFTRTRIRHALVVLEKAVKEWETKKPSILFVAQLGDLIDGLCKTRLGRPRECIEKPLALLKDFTCYHLIGNHELYNFSRTELNEILKTEPEGSSYYSFSPYEGWRFVVIDPYEICTIDPKTQDEAVKFLKQFNPNDVLSSDKDWATGLTGLTRRYLPYNGMVTPLQLSWLDKTLSAAQKSKEKVVILTHIPLCPAATDNRTILWNYEDVLEVLHKYKCVVACLAGHEHDGGFAKDANGIYHKTFESPLEIEEGDTAYATLHVYEDKIVVEGSGVVKSDVWKF